MILMKVLIAYAIPDIPHWVEKEMAKTEFKRREIEKTNFSLPGSFDAGSRSQSEDAGIMDGLFNILIYTLICLES